jgi:hypothetical protein
MNSIIIEKNNAFYCERETLEDAQWELECIARFYRINNAIIIEQTDNFLKVCEDNEEDEQIFTIKI